MVRREFGFGGLYWAKTATPGLILRLREDHNSCPTPSCTVLVVAAASATATPVTVAVVAVVVVVVLGNVHGHRLRPCVVVYFFVSEAECFEAYVRPTTT